MLRFSIIRSGRPSQRFRRGVYVVDFLGCLTSDSCTTCTLGGAARIDSFSYASFAYPVMQTKIWPVAPWRASYPGV